MNEPNRCNVIVLNDTRREINHAGCRQVMRNLYQILSQSDITVIRSYQNPDSIQDPSYQHDLKKANAVIINGEGSFHDDQPIACSIMKAAMIAKQFGKKVVLLNATWQNNLLLDRCIDCFDRIVVREPQSLQHLSQRGISAEIAPDLSFYGATDIRIPTIRENRAVVDSVYPFVTQLLRRYAHEKKLSFYYMGAIPKTKRGIRYWIRKIIYSNHRGAITPFPKFENPTRFSFLVAGRFHAVCYAIMTQTPFVAIGSNTWKTESTLSNAGFPLEMFYIPVNELSANIIDQRVAAVNEAWPQYAQTCKDTCSKAHKDITQVYFNILRNLQSPR